MIRKLSEVRQPVCLKTLICRSSPPAMGYRMGVGGDQSDLPLRPDRAKTTVCGLRDIYIIR